ncbi:MAG: Fic family protein [Candidatus Aureabacteria bacterium]|nr:Fic family protein [Candidatus Auribacterota bacterium]
MIKYEIPDNWIRYDFTKIANPLMAAKAAILSLTNIPYQRSWIDQLQVVQLKREVAGTSRIEGADFTEKELDAAMAETPEQLHTRSQRQAAAAVLTYRWIAKLPADRPVNNNLIREVHRMIITGADDDHCAPGELRRKDVNVTFGTPSHRGAEGGEECEAAFNALCDSVQNEFRGHDPLIQALALHYHFAAMHPFCDGNGRTARAMEALMLQRVGLRDTLFIAMSNYYYEEKNNYLKSLAEVRAAGNDMTPFLVFGLKGIETQCNRLFAEIRKNVARALFRDVMFNLFNRLRTTRKRVIAERHIEVLKLLLSVDSMMLEILAERTAAIYKPLKNPYKALIRDINYLLYLRAISYRKLPENRYEFFARLEWPTEITETEFFKSVKEMPKAKTHSFLS